jgi:membrane associated rhomboid family serine protease
MLPLKDLNRPWTKPHVNRLLIVVNVVIFFVFWLSMADIFLGSSFAINMEENFTMFPNEIIHGQRLYTILTSMFMHDPSGFSEGLIHLASNMLFLYIFGDNVEDTFGHFSYLLFYIFCGLTAAFSHIIIAELIDPSGLAVGVVGASGAISGALGAYLVLYPKARILTLVLAGWPIIIPIPAIIFLGFWFVMQWLLGVFDIAGGVAYWAHIGGFITGMILALIFGLKRKKAKEMRFRL